MNCNSLLKQKVAGRKPRQPTGNPGRFLAVYREESSRRIIVAASCYSRGRGGIRRILAEVVLANFTPAFPSEELFSLARSFALAGRLIGPRWAARYFEQPR